MARGGGKGGGLSRPAFAAIAPGLEPALVAELATLGIEASPEPGGVSFQADARALCAVHLWSRCAGRVTVKLGSTRVTSLDDLAAGARRMPWRDFIHPGQPVEVKATTRGTKLHFPGTLAKKVDNAIADAMRGPRTFGPRPPREPAHVLLRIDGDQATFSMDASGELMHRRGWRLATAKAPLRENLAAAVLYVAGWAPDEPFVDPMCGAGTFPIEAAGIALGHAPGRGRDFDFLRWPSVDRRLWDDMVRESGRKRADPGAPIVGSDRDEGAVRATNDNARRAGVIDRIRIRHSPLADLEPFQPPGLMVMNPPYGVRVGGDVANLHAHIGRVLKERWSGWRVGLLIADPKLAGFVGLDLQCITTFSNGGIRVGVWGGEVP